MCCSVPPGRRNWPGRTKHSRGSQQCRVRPGHAPPVEDAGGTAAKMTRARTRGGRLARQQSSSRSQTGRGTVRAILCAFTRVYHIGREHISVVQWQRSGASCRFDTRGADSSVTRGGAAPQMDPLRGTSVGGAARHLPRAPNGARRHSSNSAGGPGSLPTPRRRALRGEGPAARSGPALGEAAGAQHRAGGSLRSCDRLFTMGASTARCSSGSEAGRVATSTRGERTPG